jgi:hypothetical protein
MIYPTAFKEAMLKTFPNWPELKERLENGDESIGIALADICSKGISPVEVISAINSLNFSNLYEKAKKILEVENLYNTWNELYQSEISCKSNR